MNPIRFSLQLVRRDWRAGELRLLLAALVVAVAAIASVGFFVDRMRQALSTEARRRAHGSIVVVSGLMGVVGVDDPVPDYRLKMGASLAPLGKLSTWWRPAVSETIGRWAKRRFVVDLLPLEHRAAFEPEGKRGVSVAFVERAGGGTGRVVGHDAKAAKGRLARHLLCSDLHPLDALEAWADDRFALSIVAW